MDDTRRILQRGNFLWRLLGNARFVAGKLHIQIISIFYSEFGTLHCISAHLCFILLFAIYIKTATGFHINMVIHPIHPFVVIFLDYHLPIYACYRCRL